MFMRIYMILYNAMRCGDDTMRYDKMHALLRWGGEQAAPRPPLPRRPAAAAAAVPAPSPRAEAAAACHLRGRGSPMCGGGSGRVTSVTSTAQGITRTPFFGGVVGGSAGSAVRWARTRKEAGAVRGFCGGGGGRWGPRRAIVQYPSIQRPQRRPLRDDALGALGELLVVPVPPAVPVLAAYEHLLPLGFRQAQKQARRLHLCSGGGAPTVGPGGGWQPARCAARSSSGGSCSGRAAVRMRACARMGASAHAVPCINDGGQPAAQGGGGGGGGRGRGSAPRWTARRGAAGSRRPGT